ncbi:NAD(P)/FAD-dependent oxidoreductase [Streptomyces hesseae]|uniref:FAD-dependent oxidoreductase n=1 Tax=Streptomyces hesseae TaxID=3075519 RepID=A0ABU2SFC6_9ACTN|nr:FAD-dependent oxidoreductase [Streptomyces sp. DSM 40473]MDT0447655.1 FAD-dependent oxidoreductase [Streptomyces sp. DSM 40473]
MNASVGTDTRRVAVVGAGMAAARFAQQLLARAAPGAVEVTLYGAEPDAPYNRTLLADVLTGRHDPDGIGLPLAEGATVRTSTRVTAVAPATRSLTLADGTTGHYDTLVLATGATPVLPPLRGLYDGGPGDGDGLLGGVHVLRTLADSRALAAAARRSAHAVVIGGGVLGVSAARALAALGTATTIVHRAEWVMERHLDDRSARLLCGQLTALGITTHLAAHPVALHGAGHVHAVELADGTKLETDLVLLACGTRPRTALARAAGLCVRHGVVVDDRLATSAPGVHAIGDCAEHRGVVHGLTGPAWDQADALAAHLAGTDPGARHTGTRPLTRLSTGPLQLTAFGDMAAEHAPGHDVLRYADTSLGTSATLVLRGDRLVAGVLLGDLTATGDIALAWHRDESLPADPSYLLIPEGARA